MYPPSYNHNHIPSSSDLSPGMKLPLDGCDESGSFDGIDVIFAELALSQLIAFREAVET